MKFLFSVFLLISTLCLASCQHGGVTIEEAPMGISDIRREVVNVIGQPRSVSTNGYELLSKYYDRQEKFLEKPNEAKERFFTQVTILGDRRPYDVNVQVFKEEKIEGQYEVTGDDDFFAENWAERIRKGLYESRERRNVIDDFKAF